MDCKQFVNTLFGSALLRTAAEDRVSRPIALGSGDEARAYYDLLRRRIRKVALLRAIALASVVCIFYALRQLLVTPR